VAFNPFEELRLDPASPEEDVVRRAGRLRQRATDEAARNAVRQAVQALTASARERALHALLTHPGPQYDWPELDLFAAAFRRPPAPAGDATVPPLDMDEFRDLLSIFLAEDFDLPPQPLEPGGPDEGADEIGRQTSEALWQARVFDPGA
jgi:hypothetical protein